MVLLLEPFTNIFSFQELSHKAILENICPQNALGFRLGRGDRVVSMKGSLGNMSEKHSNSFPPFGIQIRIFKALRSLVVKACVLV